MKNKRKSKEVRLNLINQAIEEGVNSIKEFEKKVGLGITTILNYCVKEKIKFPFPRREVWKYISKNKNIQRFPERDKLIRAFCSLNKMSEELGLPRETLNQYMFKTSQHETWSRGREKVSGIISKQKREVLEELVCIINQVAEKNLEEEDKWAYGKVIEYKSLKRTYKSFQNLFGFFKKYEEAKKQGLKLSLRKLGKDFDIQPENASYILETVNETPLNHKARNRIITPEDKKEAIERSIKLEMTGEDKAYFLKLHNYVVTKITSLSPNIKLRPKVPRFIFKFSGRPLTYRLASQIYEAQDLNFSKQETMELFDIPDKIYEHAIENRKKIGTKIIKALKVFYKGRKITHPYLDS